MESSIEKKIKELDDRSAMERISFPVFESKSSASLLVSESCGINPWKKFLKNHVTFPTEDSNFIYMYMYIYTISLFYIYHNNYEYRGWMLLSIVSFHLIGKSTGHSRDPPVQTLTVKMSDNRPLYWLDLGTDFLLCNFFSYMPLQSQSCWNSHPSCLFQEIKLLKNRKDHGIPFSDLDAGISVMTLVQHRKQISGKDSWMNEYKLALKVMLLLLGNLGGFSHYKQICHVCHFIMKHSFYKTSTPGQLWNFEDTENWIIK